MSNLHFTSQRDDKRRWRWRWWAKCYAKLFGYFWLPCPVCQREFGGQECSDYSVSWPSGRRRVTCRDVFCVTIAKADEQLVRAKQEFEETMSSFLASKAAEAARRERP